MISRMDALCIWLFAALAGWEAAAHGLAHGLSILHWLGVQ